MSNKSPTPPPPGGQFLVYQTEDGKLKIDVRFEGETVWLTQQHMAALFQTTKQNVSLHIQNLFSEGELRENSVVKESLTTAADGKNYATNFYNLDVINETVAEAAEAEKTQASEAMNERETRAEPVDPALKAAGRGVAERSRILP